MTSVPKSTLAKHAEVVPDLGVTREACPLNLAPSASTTALAMGDALALTLLNKKFRSEDFGELHRRQSWKTLASVKDLMRTGKSDPVVKIGTPVRQVLIKITSARAEVARS